jgi:hemin uptake protein HemP
MAEKVSSPEPCGTSPGGAPDDACDAPRRVWTTEELLGREREVLIQHGEDVYRLRITRHGRLILYK